MANGRQRKRDVLLAKKAAEQAAKNGLAGLTPEGLTSIVSNDSNDLDNVSYSTTDGATVSIKNNRVKDSSPSVNVLGGRKGYKPGNQSMADEALLSSDGPASRSSRGFNFDDELLIGGGPNVRGSARPQAKALTDFIGEDLSPANNNNQFYTVDIDSADDLALQQDDSVISETLNDNGTVTYEVKPSNLGNPEVTTSSLTENQAQPGLYDNIVPGFERALTPTQDNTTVNQAIMHNPSNEERAAAGLTLEEQLKEQELLRQLEQETRDSNANIEGSTTIDGQGSLQNQSVGMMENNLGLRSMEGDVPGYGEVESTGRKGYMPGNGGDASSELGGRKGYMPGQIQSGGSTRGSRKGYKPGNDNDGVDQNALYEAPGYGPEAELIDEMDGYGEASPSPSTTMTTPNIHENEPGTTSPEVIAEEAKNAENEVTAATAGNPHLDGIAADAKTEVEKVKEEVENGTTSVDEAKDKIKNSLGQLGELLGIDGKDLVRGLFRYAGARIFGMSGNEAGRFAYEGFMADEVAEAKVEAAKLENMGLGAGATANQKNLKAYKEEIQRIDNDTSLSDEEKVAAKKTANEVFGVNKPTSMGRPVNIKGIRADGSEEIVVGRRNDNNSYDVFIDDQWVPIEMSGLSDVQVTSRGAEQAFERGVADPRNDVSIDNATSVSPSGVPTFKHKNQFESDNYQMAKRAVDNYPIVDAMMKDPEMRKHITSAMGGLQTYAAGNANARITAASINLAIGDSIPQKYRSATQAWLQALLRADTGAAYSETEIMDYIATNIPQVGDEDDTVAFKLAQMKTTTETMAANAGQGAKYLLGRLDGSIEPPESVKELQRLGLSAEVESSDESERSDELQAALDQY